MNAIESHYTIGMTEIQQQELSFTSAAGQSGKNSSRDVVTISPEARELNAGRTGTREQSFVTEKDWKERYGVESGTQVLANGNRRETTISGGKLEILEFDGDRLVSTTTGSMTASGLSLDVESYDASGKVSHTVHSELTKLEDGSAKMSRSIAWYESGVLGKEMQESMKLADPDAVGGIAAVVGASPDESAGLTGGDVRAAAELVQQYTHDKHLLQYAASTREYENGKVVRVTDLSHKGAYTNETNRSDQEINGVPAHDTRDLFHSVSLSVSSSEYDEQGDLLRTVNFTDNQKDGRGEKDGQLKQRITTSWYSNGELVRTSTGKMQMKEVEGAELPDRPGFLEVLQLDEQEYAAGDALSPEELLSANLEESAGQGDYFTKAIRDHLSDGSYDSVEHIAARGEDKNPYSVSWTSDYYADGELTAHRQDTESARVNTRNPGLSFRVGGALTEDLQANLLHKTEHIEESYTDGRLEKKAMLLSRESYEEREHGPDLLKTHVTGANTDALQNQRISGTLAGGVAANDSEARAASRGMAAETELVLQDLYKQLRNTA